MFRTFLYILSKLVSSLITTIFLAVLVTGCSDSSKLPQEFSPDIEALRQSIPLTTKERTWLEQNHTVYVRLGSWPPYMLTGEAVSGISVDYLKLTAKVHSITFAFLDEHDYTWPQALNALKYRSGVDMVPAIQPSPEREAYLSFTRPYQTLPWVIVTSTDAPFVAGLDDLEGRKVTMLHRFILQNEIETNHPKIKLAILKNETATIDSLKAVATGQAFATVNALPVVAYFINQYGLTNLKVAAPTQLPDLQLSMGVRSDWPELTSILNKTFTALSTKEHAAIRDQWVSQHEIGIPRRTVLRWAFVCGLGVIGTLLAITLLNATLKKKVKERTWQLDMELAERKKAEAEREKLITELEHKNEELERFVYTVSHDLKTPLITICGFAGKLMADLGTRIPKTASSDLTHINKAAMRMTDLLNDLLELSRIGRLDTHMEEVDLNLLMADVCENLQVQLASNSCNIQIEQQLPKVWGERSRLLELYQNLIENALKHGKADKTSPIIVGYEHRDQMTILFVEDSGPGIPEQYKTKVFGLFEQLDAGTGGSGVGLTLVKRIVEHHGGQVWIEEGRDKTGARFCFTLHEPGRNATS